MAWQERSYNRDSGFGGPRFIFPMPSKLTFWLLISCAVIFILQTTTGGFGDAISAYGMLVTHDGMAFTQPWRWLTYQYLHGTGGHLFFNLLSIYFLVPMLERVWGWRRVLVFYTLGGIAAGATFAIMTIFVPALGLIGASGCIFAVLGALAAIMPEAQILAMMVIPITMRTLALLYSILFFFTVLGDKDQSDAAHLGGLVFGFVVAKYGSHLVRRIPGLDPTDDGFVAESDDEPFDPRRPSTRAMKRALKLKQAEKAEQERIDQILAKVSAKGMHSLSWFEKRELKKATENQKKRAGELSKLRRM